jgi:hypothetical protein
MADKKRIYKYEFNEILKYIPEISKEEREYLNAIFAHDLLDGLTKWEIKEKIKHLKFDTNDPIDPQEAEKVKSKLLEKICE